MDSLFNSGEVVYWVGYGKYVDTWPGYEVKWGILDEIVRGIAYINIYELKNNARIDGVSIWDWKPDNHYRKLPKGWTYNTELFKVTYDSYPDIVKSIKLNHPEEILMGIKSGALIRVKDNINWRVVAEITKQGWVLRREFDEKHYDNVTVDSDKLCKTYEEAYKKKQALIDEFKRQAELTDEEWSKEQIEKSISHLKKLLGFENNNEYIRKVRDFVMGLDNIADVETRVCGIQSPRLEWKYWKKKKWSIVEV